MHFENSGPQVTLRDLERVTKLIGCELPPSYRQFLMKHNGGTPRPSGFSIEGKLGSEMECVEMFHSVNRGTFHNDLEVAIRSDRDQRQPQEHFAIPAEAIWIGAAIAGEIVLFVRGLRIGQVWLKERLEDHHNPMEGMCFLASSFEEFLKKLVPCEWDRPSGDRG